MRTALPSRPPGSRALRLGRSSEAGRVYLITFTTHQRLALFSDWSRACAASASLASRQAWAGSSLLCWVLMPDHWHGLLRLGEGESLSRAVGRAKASASRRLQAGARAKLWAPGFHDHALRREESLVNVARYVVLNPVRAGLVCRIGDYPFWDAVWLG